MKRAGEASGRRGILFIPAGDDKAQKDQPEDADPAVCQDRSVRADFRRSCEPGIFAVKPAAQRWLKGKPETVTIPEDDTPSGQEDAAAGNQNDPVDQTLSKENYEEILKSMYQAVKEAKRELYLSVRHRRKKTGMRRQRGSPRLYQE